MAYTQEKKTFTLELRGENSIGVFGKDAVSLTITGNGALTLYSPLIVNDFTIKSGTLNIITEDLPDDMEYIWNQLLLWRI